MRPRPPGVTQMARYLRRNTTGSEQVLWSRLRGHRLDGLKFRRQEPLGPFFADFVCLEKMLVVELDGVTHAGRNGEGRDAERTAWLNSRGYRVIRFGNNEVAADLDRVVAQIMAAVRQARLAPPL